MVQRGTGDPEVAGFLPIIAAGELLELNFCADCNYRIEAVFAKSQ